jgi:CheY-like chemotaxis protein
MPRIAVVDDDPVFLELMHDLLASGAGYEVVTSLSCAEAHQLVRQHRPDLVILDLMMGRNQFGWTVLDALRGDPDTRQVPVLVCSAAVSSLQAHSAHLRHQSARAIVKPFDIDDLLTTVQSMLADRAQPSS